MKTSWKLTIFGVLAALTLLGVSWGTVATQVSAAAGDITIAKAASGPDANTTLFSFTATAGACAPATTSFSLANNASTSFNCPASTAVIVTETVPVGWTLTDITCSPSAAGTTFTKNVPGHSVTITESATPAMISCTFINSETPVSNGSISIHKSAPGAGGYSFPFSISGPSPCAATFGLQDGGTQPYTGCAAGSYTVSENVPSGWVLTTISCSFTVGSSYLRSGNSVGITLAAGGTVDCTFYNSSQIVQNPINSITITKSAPGAGSTSFPFTISGSSPCNTSFSLQDGGSTSFNCVSGSYVVTENVPAGWSLSSITCTGTYSGTYTANQYGNSVTINLNNSYNNYNPNYYNPNDPNYYYNNGNYNTGNVTCRFNNVTTSIPNAVSIAAPGTAACGVNSTVTVSVRTVSGGTVPDGTAVVVTTNPNVINNTFYTVGGAISFQLSAPSTTTSVAITATSGSATASAVVAVSCVVQQQVVVQAPPSVVVAAAAPAPVPPIVIQQPSGVVVSPPKAGNAGLFGVVGQSDWRIFLGVFLAVGVSALGLTRARAKSEE